MFVSLCCISQAKIGRRRKGTVIRLRNSCSASIANASRRWSVRFISNVDAICRNNERGRRRVAIVTINDGSQRSVGRDTQAHKKV